MVCVQAKRQSLHPSFEIEVIVLCVSSFKWRISKHVLDLYEFIYSITDMGAVTVPISSHLHG